MSTQRSTIHFVRHGEVQNPEHIRYGRLPGYHLAADGRLQVEQTAAFLTRHPIRHIYASPLERTQQTATLLGMAFPYCPISLDARILEDKTAPEFEGQPRTRPYTYPTVPNSSSETTVEIIARLRRFVEEKLGQHAGSEIVAVSHGDPIGLLYHSFVYGTTDNPSTTIYPAFGSVFSFVFDGLRLVSVWYYAGTSIGANRS